MGIFCSVPRIPHRRAHRRLPSDGETGLGRAQQPHGESQGGAGGGRISDVNGGFGEGTDVDGLCHGLVGQSNSNEPGEASEKPPLRPLVAQPVLHLGKFRSLGTITTRPRLAQIRSNDLPRSESPAALSGTSTPVISHPYPLTPRTRSIRSGSPQQPSSKTRIQQPISRSQSPYVRAGLVAPPVIHPFHLRGRSISFAEGTSRIGPGSKVVIRKDSAPAMPTSSAYPSSQSRSPQARDDEARTILAPKAVVSGASDYADLLRPLDSTLHSEPNLTLETDPMPADPASVTGSLNSATTQVYPDLPMYIPPHLLEQVYSQHNSPRSSPPPSQSSLRDARSVRSIKGSERKLRKILRVEGDWEVVREVDWVV